MTLETIGKILRSYREERGILRFFDEQFKAKLDPWQEEAAMAFADPDPKKRRISLQACAGPGKTFIEAGCGLWFLGTQGEENNHPKGAAVSISRENLKDNLWAEFAKLMGISPFCSSQFTWTTQRIFANDHPETWFISARAWPKSANADEQGKTLSGLHAKYVVILVDESGAIPTTVLRAGEQALSTCYFGKIMQAGNPISLEGMLHAAANELRHLWHIIRITGDPEDPNAWVYSPRVGDQPLEWAKEQIATYGRENPWVKSYILGQFPPQSINSLLGLEDVEAAMARHLRKPAYEWAQKRLGVDVARYGDDRTVIFPRQGLVGFLPVVMRHARDSAVSTDIAARVMMAKNKWGSELEFIDATGGWAAGASDVMRSNGVTAINVQFHADAIDPRYYNRRAEIWFGMSEWIKGGAVLPKVAELVAELTTPTYTFKDGKFLLEPKELVKKRMGRSPDIADALALTFGLPDMPREAMTRLRRQARATTMDDVEEVRPSGRATSMDDRYDY